MTDWKQELGKLIDAMVAAEGGEDAFIRAVQCSFPATSTYTDARQIAVNTVYHRLWDYAMQDPGAFIDFLGARWAPVGASNDPTNLNANWAANVRALYLKA